MCNFFSCIVTKAGEVLFTQSKSHEIIISRSGLKDNLRHFVRVEYSTKSGYIIDAANIPEWYERVAAKAEANVIATYKRVAPAWDKYEQVKQLAGDKYKRVRLLAWDEWNNWVAQSQLNVYKRARDLAWDEYERAKQLALDEYKSAIANVQGYLKA